MAIAHVKNVGSASGSMVGSLTIIVPAAGVAAGNFVVVGLALGASGLDWTISDTRGNTWVAATGSPITYSTTRYRYFWVSKIATALVSGDTIVVTGTKDNGAVDAEEFSGVNSTTTDGEGNATGSSTTPSASATPAAAGLVVGMLGLNSSTDTITGEDSDTDGGAGWSRSTYVGNGNGVTVFWKITSSTAAQTYNPTLSGSTIWGEFIQGHAEAVTDRAVGPRRSLIVNQPASQSAAHHAVGV